MTTEIERKQKIWEEIVQEAIASDPRKREDEMSVNDFAKQCGIGRETSLNLLEEKVKLGVMKRRITKSGTYYSPL